MFLKIFLLLPQFVIRQTTWRSFRLYFSDLKPIKNYSGLTILRHQIRRQNTECLQNYKRQLFLDVLFLIPKTRWSISHFGKLDRPKKCRYCRNRISVYYMYYTNSRFHTHINVIYANWWRLHRNDVCVLAYVGKWNHRESVFRFNFSDSKNYRACVRALAPSYNSRRTPKVRCELS